MPTDDELLDLLGETLSVPTDRPAPDRVASLRAAVAAAGPAGSASSGSTVGSAGSPPLRLPHPTADRRPWLRAVPLGLAAAAAVAVAFFIGRATVDDGPSVASGVVEFDGALTAPESGSRATVRVERTGIGRVVTLDTKDLQILPVGEYYELWFVGADDEPSAPQRVSAGTFHPDEDGRSQVTFAAAVDPANFAEISVTAEPADGDPGPSAEEVLRADLPA